MSYQEYVRTFILNAVRSGKVTSNADLRLFTELARKSARELFED